MYCIYCGKEKTDQATVCQNCGRQSRNVASDVPLTCLACQARNSDDAIYCWNCGERLERDKILPLPLPGIIPGEGQATARPLCRAVG